MTTILLREVLPWYLALLLAGWIAFPLAYRLLPFLPDRGYTLARPLGLLVWGFLFWLLGSLRLLQNDLGGVVLALLLVLALSTVALWRSGWRELWAWLRQHGSLLLVAEILFLAAFLFWCLVRSLDAAASGTEKPMELAFINAILHSKSFPPHDPWLSGYAISYYYFGYVMVAMLAHLSGVSGSVAFNLGGASWFALTALSAFGLLANLLALRNPRHVRLPLGDLTGGLLAPLFLLLVSNLEGFLEMLHSLGIFWQPDAAGNLTSSFWQWLDIQELTTPPVQPFGWLPQRPGGIWWWRASRVLQDYDLAGGSREIIDEFPFFSYYLADLHPHVLAMPFVLLAISLCLHIYLRTRSEQDAPVSLAWLRRPDLWLAAVAFGGLSFLNTWDFPIYLALFGAALGLARFQQTGWNSRLLLEVAGVSGAVALAGIGLYFPFYIGFASQAGGLLPSLVFFTRGIHFWVMFGALLLPVFAWLLFAWRRWSLRLEWRSGLIFAAGVTGGLWLLSSLVGKGLSGTGQALGIYGDGPGDSLIIEATLRRLLEPGTWLTLFALMTLTWALLTARHMRGASPAEPTKAMEPGAGLSSERFILLLVLLGCGLTLFPEFFYLRDQFGWRMNTIFKFYFQAWILWSLAAAYGVAVLLEELRGFSLAATAVGSFVVVTLALIYPYLGLSVRMNPQVADYSQLSLDGAVSLERYNPDEYDAIDWLSRAPAGVVVEAVGGSYSGYARVSTFSGQPTVLGWPGHESQWRGGAEEMGSRESDIELLYRSNNWDQALEIIRRYQIRYIYVGGLERGKYRVNESKFAANLEPVFENGQAIIYEVPQMLLMDTQVDLP